MASTSGTCPRRHSNVLAKASSNGARRKPTLQPRGACPPPNTTRPAEADGLWALVGDGYPGVYAGSFDDYDFRFAVHGLRNGPEKPLPLSSSTAVPSMM